MRELTIFKIITFAIILVTTTTSYADWCDPEVVYEADNDEIIYADIDLDNRLFFYGTTIPWTPVYARAHIAFSAYEDSEWRTFYKVYDLVDGWSLKIDVDKEEKAPSGYHYYYSDISTRPGIRVDNDDDAADIAFCHQRVDWYYDYFPALATPVREILFSWKTPVAWDSRDLNPPDKLHHISGLQKAVNSPCIDYMEFYPKQRYGNGVFWSQNDFYSTSDKTILYNYQAGAKNKARSHIDWGEQTRACSSSTSIGEEPYSAVGFNRTLNPSPGTGSIPYMLAVVSYDSSGIHCSLSKIPTHSNPHVWNTHNISGSSYALPSCAFEYPSDPSTTAPDLHVVYRQKINATTFKYVHRELTDTWGTTPTWSTPTTLATIYLSSGDDFPAAGPVIAYAEDNTQYIAYIGASYQIYVRADDGQVSTTQITDSNDYDDGEEHMWLRLAVDDVYLTNGLCPNVVYDGEDSSGNRNLYWTRYYE